jgi:hypothetical protein
MHDNSSDGDDGPPTDPSEPEAGEGLSRGGMPAGRPNGPIIPELLAVLPNARVPVGSPTPTVADTSTFPGTGLICHFTPTSRW